MSIRVLLLAAAAIGLSVDIVAAQANRPGADEQGNHRLELVTFSKKVQDADPNLNKQALLYHPTKKFEGKIPLIVLLHGAGGTKKKDITAFKGNRDVKWVMTSANSKYVPRGVLDRPAGPPASLDQLAHGPSLFHHSHVTADGVAGAVGGLRSFRSHRRHGLQYGTGG